MRVGRRSTIALATVGALASTGTAYLGARNLLVGQATQARTIIPKSWEVPPRADGVYSPGGGPVERWQRGMSVDLHLMIFGDSTATGYGCFTAEEVPGVLIARGLAERTGKRIRLSTKAIVGATSRGVSGQVDAMFVAGPPPDAAVMMLGANDVTALNGISQSARRLGTAVRKLRARGAVVVVGTCPDLGRDRRHPPAAAVAGALAGSATGPRAGRRRQGGRRCAGAAGGAAGAAIPGRARADVLRRRFPPLADGICARGRAATARALRGAGRKGRRPTLARPLPAVDAGTSTPLSVVSRLWRRPVPGSPAPLSRPPASD